MIFAKCNERTEATLLHGELLGPETSFRVLAEAIGAAIFVSQGNRLHYVNRAAETITGYTRKELLSTNFWDLVRPDYREFALVRERPCQGDILLRAPHELRILAKNREERWLAIKVGIMEFDGVLCSLVCAFDLTERKKAEEQLRLQAVTDPLTGLGNYRRLVEALDAEVKRSGRTGRPFAVLILDLDELKKINDRHGHLVGSRALCRLANALRVHCRAIDTATRYGGDEFAVILPETAVGEARLVAARIQERLAADSQEPKLSVSIGVTAYPEGGKTIEALLCKADRELYGMKSGKGERTHRVSLQPGAGKYPGIT